MRKLRRLLGSERGVALPLAMILLMILTMLTIAFMTLGAVEPQISQNLSDGARARQLAESGIEWSYNQLAGKQFNDPTLLGGTLTTGGACGAGISCLTLGSANQALPGLTGYSGGFTATLRNDRDSIAGDQSLIGAGNTLDSSAGFDNNNIVILKSTGNVNGASRTVTAVVERGKLAFNAAVNLPGAQADTYTIAPPSSGAYSIDGRDWTDANTTSPTGAAPVKYGIAAGTTSTESTVQAAYDSLAKRAYVQGKTDGDGYSTATDGSPVAGATGAGRNTIADDTTLTDGAIQDFMTNLAANPQTQVLMSTQACAYPASGGLHNKPEGLRMASTGTPNIVTVTNNASSCGGSDNINQTVNLGTASSPKMLYIKGEFDPDSLFRGLVVDGSDAITGYGILVIEDSDLAFLQTGQFRWNGIVLVTGRNNSTAFLGNSNTEIRGALVTNEKNGSEQAGYYEFYVSTGGTMKVRASKENVDRALLALYNMRISAYRED
jgi:hypothetical protein